MTKPSRLVVLLGAGASRPTVPLTACLTQLVRSRSYARNPDPAAPGWESLMERLAPDADFEDLIAAALTKAEEARTAEEQWTWWGAAWDVAHKVAFEIARASSGSNQTPPVVSVLERLTQEFRCVVGTLNWDDLPLQAQVPWYDGYVHQAQAPFSPDFIRTWALQPAVLCWLHGSVHFNRAFPINYGRQWESLEWDPDPLGRWTFGFQPGPNDAMVPYFPVITGHEKALQVFRRPFFDYWSVVHQALNAATGLLVIGYSGRDPHLNVLVQDAVRHNASLGTIVWVTYDTASQPSPQLTTTLTRVFRHQSYGSASLAPGGTLQELLIPRSAGLSGWPSTYVVTFGIEAWMQQPQALDDLIRVLANP